MSNSPSAQEARLAPSFLPATAVLEMTYRCNHRCLFCSCPWEAENGGYDRGAELTTEQWKGIIGKLCTMGVTNLAFTGGEALLRPDIWDLIAFAASCTTEHIETKDGVLESAFAPPKIHLLSNGLVVNTAVLEHCKKYNVQLSLSLPGLSTFRAHTQAGDPDHILAMFSAAKEMGVVTIVNTAVTRINLHELDRVLAAALLAGAEQVLLNRFLPGGRGLSHANDLMLTAEQILEMLDTAEEVLEAAGRFGSLGTEVPRCLVDPARYKRMSVSTRCGAALGFFVVGPNGWVRVCNHSPIQIAPFDQIASVKTHPYWRTFTQKQYLPKECSGCKHEAGCDGGCREAAHIVRGSVSSLDVAMERARISDC